MKVYCVENDKESLLLVDDELHVINGAYNLIKHRDGSLTIPHTGFKVKFLLTVPAGKKYEDYDPRARIYPALEWAEKKLKENAA